MKSFLVLFALLVLPVFAVAGSEDHIHESCYSASVEFSKNIPQTFCFDYAQLDSQKAYLMLSGAFLNLPKSMKVKSFQYETEDKVNFLAEAVLVNIWNSGCGYGEQAVLTIKGSLDITQGEQINPKALEISVEHIVTSDTCHSYPQTDKYLYQLSR